MARSLGFGSNPTNLNALFRLAFAAPPPIGLSLLVRLSRWPIIQKVRRHPATKSLHCYNSPRAGSADDDIGCSDLEARLRLFVGVRFQVYFTPLVGVLFTFPSRYWFAIGRARVLRLGGWSPHVQTGLHVSRLTRVFRSALRVRG